MSLTRVVARARELTFLETLGIIIFICTVAGLMKLALRIG